ncbi:hypothetical protein CTEN210_03505 [Chaetoceros tenuissimus]|uniref:MYND-type domain-containing protein n=1 Tax=Chaetoceros tenuissimus TaxID=426638 RepID=A0AAD3CLE7_9STRA|nr:hypothetical protein CTEN210_03505 [Chaetoceros tenuissimus]
MNSDDTLSTSSAPTGVATSSAPTGEAASSAPTGVAASSATSTTPKLMERNKCLAEGCNMNTNLRPCTACNFAKYCSRRCQVKDWNRHKEHCRKFGNTSDPTSQLEDVKRDSKQKKRKLKAGANSATASCTEVFEAVTADAAQMRENILNAARAEAVQMKKDILSAHHHIAATAEAAQMKKDILNDARIAATADAAQMRENILNDARIAADADAAQMKKDILNAAHVATTLEATRMKKDILNTARIAATLDATQMKKDILNAARAENVQMKKQILNDARAEAATPDATRMKKDILNTARTEAFQMKKDILNAARTDATHDATQMREDILNAARIAADAAVSQMRSRILRAAHAEAVVMRENYLRDTATFATEEAARLRDNILNAAHVDAVYERKRKNVQHLKDHAKEKLQEKREELLKEVADQCPIPPNDLPSIQEMNSDFIRFCKDKEKLGEIIQEIETCYFPSLLHQMKNMFFHICICDINLMQKYGDEEVVIPYALFDVAHSQLPHVGHLPDLQTLFANLRGDSAEIWSWWIPEDFLECVVFGLNHAFNRGYFTRNLKGKSVHIHCSYSMRQGHDVYHAPYGLPTVQRFRVCPKAVYPDFVLKITFGANGFFDPATQIHLVRIEGMACNIRISIVLVIFW